VGKGDFMKLPFGFAHASFTNSDGYKFNVNAFVGFIEIYSMADEAGKSSREIGAIVIGGLLCYH